ncbi:hypothetical protein [Streptomyces sp. RTd22]|uniref:hypothetical protein n=1 Tax=Streptomyces sp. RTd22 TaxID=1841249 RepID=UPI0007C449EA|nr:hypothetical protein [Streptomyces sp. RTd22]
MRHLKRLRLPAASLLAGAALLAAPQAAARADDGDLAGTRAGEGRAHPGRTAAPTPSTAPSADPARPSRTPADPGGRPSGRDQADPRPSLVPDWTPSSLRLPHEQERRGADELPQDDRPYATERTAASPGDRATRVLPLGTGLALAGLGLALAFLGLRLRRH